MLRRVIIILLVLLSVHPIAYASSFEQRISAYYGQLINEIQRHGIQGPLAHELAQFAILRQLHEDGPRRSPRISMNGMIPAGLNKEIMDMINMPLHMVKKVRANDGQRSYCVEGPKANVVSGVAIALWFDRMIGSSRRFSETDKAIWEQSKTWSKEIHKPGELASNAKFRKHSKKRLEMIAKANKMYGPKGSAIEKQREKLISVFYATGYTLW